MCSRASDTLSRNDAHYGKLATAAARDINPSSLLGLHLSQAENVRQAVLDDNDISRAIDLLREAAAADPDGCGPWDWTMLQLRYPEVANQLVSHIRQNKVNALSRSIGFELAPYLNLRKLLHVYHMARLTDDEGMAARTITEINDALMLYR